MEKESGAGPTDGATQESFDHWMQLQDNRTLCWWLCQSEAHLCKDRSCTNAQRWETACQVPGTVEVEMSMGEKGGKGGGQRESLGPKAPC